MATLASTHAVRFTFWQKMAMGLSGFIIFGFAQFALRGMIDYRTAPAIFHVHGAIMLGWLALLNIQSQIAGRGGLALHRRLGWLSTVMVPAMVVIAIATCVTALRTGYVPPMFTPAYFLALIPVTVVIFAIVIAIAVARRRELDWHRRLMIGSTIILLDPALGRVLPMPLMVPWHEWTTMLIELAVVGLIVRHDRATLGRVHPATIAVAIAVTLCHVLVELLALVPWWISLTARVAAA